jgi:hypothetical protein
MKKQGKMSPLKVSNSIIKEVSNSDMMKSQIMNENEIKDKNDQ